MHFFRTVSLLAVSAAMLGACSAREESTNMTPPAVDWKSLEFSCVHEADRLPKPDPTSDDWYREGNAAFNVGVKKGSNDLLISSFEILRKAAEHGHVKAMNNLVLAYLNGDGVKQSDAKAVEWAERLIRLNVGMGYYHMGVFLEQGIGVKQNPSASLTYFRKAADLGNPQGQLIAAKRLRAAFAQTPDRERGFQISTAMLACALDQGLSRAGYELGHHYSSIDPIKALAGFQAAARLGHNQSLFELQLIFLNGEYGVEKDAERAACYKRLLDEWEADKTKTFPNIDKVCPLPPKPMPR